MMDDSLHPIVVPEMGLPGSEDAWLPHGISECIDRVVIPADAIAARVETLADEISATYAAEGVLELTALVVLRGAFMFAADLGRALVRAGRLELRAEFISVCTYGSDIKGVAETEREVRVNLSPEGLWGRHILLVEDIVDQGFTLARIQRILEDEGAASVRICSLLVKELQNPSEEVQALRDSLIVNFAGFQIPDRWIVGYGTDADGQYRMLPHVCTVDESMVRGA